MAIGRTAKTKQAATDIRAVMEARYYSRSILWTELLSTETPQPAKSARPRETTWTCPHNIRLPGSFERK